MLFSNKGCSALAVERLIPSNYGRYFPASLSSTHRWYSKLPNMANIPTPIPILKLNDGMSIPMLGYGTGTAWYKSDNNSSIDRATVDAVKMALKLGYHHIDCAEVYNTEAEVGVAIKESKMERDKLYITTKVITNIANIPKAIDMSLNKLQMDHVDLYLIHSPFFAESDEDLQNAWREMEKVRESGKARSVGVSNYLEPHFKATLATAKITPAINQTEFHPYLQHGSLIPYQESKGIATAAYAPLTPVTKARPGPCDEYLAFLAKKYYVSEGDICLRWCIDSGAVAITTSGKEQRLSDYLRAMTFSMTPKEVKRLSEAGMQKHFRGFWQKKFDASDRS